MTNATLTTPYNVPQAAKTLDKAAYSALTWLIDKCTWLDADSGQFRGNLPARMAIGLHNAHKKGLGQKIGKPGDLAYGVSWKQGDKAVFLRWTFGSFRSTQNAILFTLNAFDLEDVSDNWSPTF